MSSSFAAETVFAQLTGGPLCGVLSLETAAGLRALGADRLHSEISRFLERPIAGSAGHDTRLALNPVLAAQWLALFADLELQRTLQVYEPCAGGSEPVLLAVDAYTDGAGSYTTINLNRKLADEFRGKLDRIRVPATIIEADAAGAARYLTAKSVEAVCFHHALNDLMQTAAAEQRGMDTRTIDWWASERTMIGWMAENFERDGGISEHKAVLSAVTEAARVVKPGGYLIFDHFTWEAHRHAEWLPWQLFTDMLPMARRWIAAALPSLKEVTPAGLDPQWWMVLRAEG